MDILFKIYHFSSTKDLAKHVTDRLNIWEERAADYLIDDTSFFSVDTIEKDMSSCIILLLKKEDVRRVKELAPEDEIQADVPPLLIVCVGFPKSNVLSLNYPNVIKVGESTESIRMEIVDFYKKSYRKQSFGYYVGRTRSIEQFQSLRYSERYQTTKAVFISGHPGTGREAFARECIRLSSDTDYKEPCTISMGDNGNIELFIVQLNSILQKFDENTIKSLLSSETNVKVNTTIELLNQLFLSERSVIIYDDARSCLRYDRRLADWFSKIIMSPSLIGRLHMFVISTISVNYTKAKVQDGVAYFTLYDLTPADRKMLVYLRFSEEGVVNPPEEDVKFILDSPIYSPHMIVRVIRDYRNLGGINYVKAHMTEYLSISDSKLRAIILKYKDSKERDFWNLLILLSKMEYISSDVLSRIFGDTFDIIQRHLIMMVSDGIVECFGEIDNVYRLDSSVSDNLRRNKYRYNDISFEQHLDEVMSEIISENPQITEDYSVYLYKVKEELSKHTKPKDALLIPSIIITSIIDAYNRRDYRHTVDLCNWILDQKPHYFNDVYREVRYWKCLALARLRSPLFYECVDSFKYDADYHFLQGFMYRNRHEYAKAENEFKKAILKNPAFSRAKRELVIALLGQHRYSEALEYAKENYERDRENTYHLLAYYRCLIRKTKLSLLEKEELKRLLVEADDLFVSDEYKKGMRFEYKRLVEQKPDNELSEEATVLEENAKKLESSYLEDIVNEFRVSRGKDPINIVKKPDYEYDE